MDSRFDRRRKSPLPIAALSRFAFAALATVVIIAAAEAHKLKAFATAEGPLVSGYAYFTPGGRAQQADVTIRGPRGVEVLKTEVNERGEFHFVAKQRVDYTITVDGGDSHVATFTIHASDLPDSLPAPADGKILPLDPPTATTAVQADVAQDSQASDSAASSATPAAVAQHLVVTDPATLHAIVRESVAREVNPLREQLDAFEEQVGWRDVVSGLGYIFGLCGVAYFFATWRENRRSARAPQPQAQAREGARKAA